MNTHNQCKGDNTNGNHHRENYNDGKTFNAGEHMITQQHQHQGRMAIELPNNPMITIGNPPHTTLRGNRREITMSGTHNGIIKTHGAARPSQTRAQEEGKGR